MMRFHGTDPASIERRLAEIAEDERRDRRAFFRTLGLLVFWPVVGLVGMGWGFQMDDPVWGPVIFLLAAIVADLGILGTMLSAYFRDG
jgi:hypothetical protein